MPVVRILILQRQIADVAKVRHNTLVDALDVLRQIGDNPEPHATLVTLVRQLPGMGQHVARQVVLVLERLLADFALSSNALVVLYQRVFPHDGDRFEDFPTMLALVFPCLFPLQLVLVGRPVVAHFVHFQTLASAVPERAEAALERSDARIVQTEVDVVRFDRFQLLPVALLASVFDLAGVFLGQMGHQIF